MTEKKFFDLLKEKMDGLRPPVKHRSGDWAALHSRLDQVMPQAPDKPRRPFALPLFFGAALLFSNAAWVQSYLTGQSKIMQLEAKLSGLQNAALLPGNAPLEVRIDTIWKTVYLPISDLGNQDLWRNETTNSALVFQPRLSSRNNLADIPALAFSSTEALQREATSENISLPAAEPSVLTATMFSAEAAENLGILGDLAAKTTAIPSIKTLQLSVIEQEKQKEIPPVNLLSETSKKKKAGTFEKDLTQALRPKFFSIGANVAWLDLLSPQLMHKGGFAYGLSGQIGFSPHWSLTLSYKLGQLHYKAHNPESILGKPVLPEPSSPDHHYLEFDLTGQKIRQFDVGFQYSFTQIGKLKPFIGMGWGGIIVQPFVMEYELQHEPTDVIEKGFFEVTQPTLLNNIIRMGAGIEVPLSGALNLKLEGFYLRQWDKKNGNDPDLMRIGIGLNWLITGINPVKE